MTRTDPTPRITVTPVVAPERRTVGRAAIVVSSLLVLTGAVLGLAELLSLASLALLGALASSIAAVKEEPRRPFGWVLASLAALGLVAVTLASLLTHH